MAYEKQTWANGIGGLTPISATRLNHIEDGIEEASHGSGFIPGVLVAASDASEEVQLAADFVCDGDADEVQLQAAVDAVTDFRAFTTDFAGDEAPGWSTGLAAITDGELVTSDPWVDDTFPAQSLLLYGGLAPRLATRRIAVDATWVTGGLIGVALLHHAFFNAGLHVIVTGSNAYVFTSWIDEEPTRAELLAGTGADHSASLSLTNGQEIEIVAQLENDVANSQSVVSLWVDEVLIFDQVTVADSWTTSNPPAGNLNLMGPWVDGGASVQEATYYQPIVTGMVELSQGNFYVDAATEVMVQGLNIRGNDTKVHCMGTGADVAFSFPHGDAYAHVSGIEFHQDSGGDMGAVSLSNFSTVTDCLFWDFQTTPAVQTTMPEATDVSVMNSVFSGCDVGVWSRSWNPVIRENKFVNCAVGVDLLDAYEFEVANNRFEECAIGTRAESEWTEAGSITNNRFNGYDDPTNYVAIVLDGLNEEGIFGVQVTDNTALYADLIQCTNVVSCDISNNVSSQSQGNGITLLGCKGNRVTNNIITEAIGSGIHVDVDGDANTSDGNLIAFNSVRPTSHESWSVWDVGGYGIRIVAGTANIVYGNDLRETAEEEWVEQAFADGGTSTVTTMTGNWT